MPILSAICVSLSGLFGKRKAALTKKLREIRPENSSFSQHIEARYLSGLVLRLFSLEAGTNAPKGRENHSNESQLKASSDGLS